MKKLQCEVCGSVHIKKISDDTFECQSCGVQYSNSDIQKLLVDITGKVKIDQSDRVKNLYMLAKADIDKSDCGNALRYYEDILLEQPTSWEANFFVEYIKDWNCKIAEIHSAASNYISNFDSVLNLIKTVVAVREEQTAAIETMYSRSQKLHDMLASGALHEYNDTVSEQPFVPSRPSITDLYQARCEKVNNERAARQKLVYNYNAIYSIMGTLGDKIEQFFPNNEDLKQYSLNAWKIYAEELYMLANVSKNAAFAEKANEYAAKIRGSDPNYMVVAESEASSTERKGANKLNSAEDWIHLFEVFGLVPFTSPVGILSLCFISKAKRENGGILSKRAKRGIILGVCGFVFWGVILYFLMNQ